MNGGMICQPDLSLRLDALSDAMNENGRASQVAGATLPPAAQSSDYVKLINSLQEQLHAEREKNKHLKGA